MVDQDQGLRWLVVKTSSMGDVIHTLPALTEAVQAIPTLRVDWVIEHAFAEIPRWHPAVERVIPIRLRQLRTVGGLRSRLQAVGSWIQSIRAVPYDGVLDAQGLWKSVAWARCARRKRGAAIHGFSHDTVREWGAAIGYTQHHAVSRQLHAIERQRRLWSQALGYPLSPAAVSDHGIRDHLLASAPVPGSAGLICIQGTSWPSKTWPLSHWRTLVQRAGHAGIPIQVLSGSEPEYQRALQITEGIPGAVAHAPHALTETARLIAAAAGVVALDTGLGHLAAALGVPIVALYGPTSFQRSGIQSATELGQLPAWRCRPCLRSVCPITRDPQHTLCMDAIDPDQVWAAVLAQCPALSHF